MQITKEVKKFQDAEIFLYNTSSPTLYEWERFTKRKLSDNTTRSAQCAFSLITSSLYSKS